jgi:hypothetical protein
MHSSFMQLQTKCIKEIKAKGSLLQFAPCQQMLLKRLQLPGTRFLKKNEKENRAKLLKDHHPRLLISPCQSNGPHPPTCKSVIYYWTAVEPPKVFPIRSIGASRTPNSTTHPPTSLDAYSYAIQPARGVQVCRCAGVFLCIPLLLATVTQLLEK